MSRAVEALRAADESGALDALCSRHGIEVLTLFGSAAVDPEHAADVDLAVQFSDESPKDLVAVVNDLTDLVGTDSVDVLDLRRAGPVARFAALVEGLPLAESRTGIWANSQMSAALEFYKTEWLRRLDLEVLAD
ncbi:nucleotidyltransferase family protein [Thalassiella azotivora]